MKLTRIKNYKKYLALTITLMICCYGLLAFAIAYSFFLKPFPRYYIYLLVIFAFFTFYMTYILTNELYFKWKKLIVGKMEIKQGVITHIVPGSPSLSPIPLVKIDNEVVPLKGLYNKKDFVNDGELATVAYFSETKCAVAIENK